MTIFNIGNNSKNNASYLVMSINNCMAVAKEAKTVKIAVDKLTEATQLMAKLSELEQNNQYNAHPKAQDFIDAFVKDKDEIIMSAIKRSLSSGESKQKILECRKFFSEEIVEFINAQ